MHVGGVSRVKADHRVHDGLRFQGRGGAVEIHEIMAVYALAQGRKVAPGRLIYVHVARGAVHANDVALEAGDALKLSDTEQLQLKDGRDAEVLVFDLPSE